MKSKTNPNIRQLECGIQELKVYDIFPLSVGAQIKFANKIKDMIDEYDDEASDTELVKMAMDFITENVPDILPLVNPDLTVDDITNDQLIELAQIIYEVNYEAVAKKLRSLRKKEKK